MQYSKATNYALHSMVFLALIQKEKTIGVRPLAEFQNVSPTYLSKVLTKLVKAGFIQSTPGAKGGYQLIKDTTDITLLEIIHAIEGSATLFNCRLNNNDLHDNHHCLIQEVMEEAEKKMENYLKKQTLQDIVKQVDKSKMSYLLSKSV